MAPCFNDIIKASTLERLFVEKQRTDKPLGLSYYIQSVFLNITSSFISDFNFDIILKFKEIQINN